MHTTIHTYGTGREGIAHAACGLLIELTRDAKSDGRARQEAAIRRVAYLSATLHFGGASTRGAQGGAHFKHISPASRLKTVTAFGLGVGHTTANLWFLNSGDRKR